MKSYERKSDMSEGG